MQRETSSEMGKAQIPLGSSRHDSTRSTCRASRARRVECVEPCCWTSSTQPKCMGRVEQVESCRDVTWRAKWNLGLNTTARSVVFLRRPPFCTNWPNSSDDRCAAVHGKCALVRNIAFGWSSPIGEFFQDDTTCRLATTCRACAILKVGGRQDPLNNRPSRLRRRVDGLPN